MLNVPFILYPAGSIKENAFMAVPHVSHTFVFKAWRLYPACIKVLSVALTEERLSHYCANDMQLLKEHFEIAE